MYVKETYQYLIRTTYLTGEVFKRQLTSRAMLGTRLAKDGNRVFIFEHTFFDRIWWPSPGIYIGKNCFITEIPHTNGYYKKMKDSKIDIWFLKVECGIYKGNKKQWEKSLRKRFDFANLDKNDKVLFLGNWQKEAYSHNNLSGEQLISGSTNIDVFQKKYSNFF